LQSRPAEYGDGDEVDAGLAHQADVLLPDRLGPLLGVVVAPVREVRQPQVGHRATSTATSSSRIASSCRASAPASVISVEMRSTGTVWHTVAGPTFAGSTSTTVC